MTTATDSGNVRVLSDRRQGQPDILRDLVTLSIENKWVAEKLISQFDDQDFNQVGLQDVVAAVRHAVDTNAENYRGAICDQVGVERALNVLARPTDLTVATVDAAIRDLSTAKRSADVVRAVNSGDLAGARAALSRLESGPATGDRDDGRVTSDTVARFLAETEENRKRKYLGPRTGLAPLDETTLGLGRGQVWALGAPTGGGKTTLACQIAAHGLKENAAVVYLSLEMSSSWILARLAGAFVGLSATRIFMGQVADSDRGKVDGTLALLADCPLWVYRDRTDLAAIQRTVRTVRGKVGADKDLLFVVDFLQNVGVRGSATQLDRMATAAVGLQHLAATTGACCLILSQFSQDTVRAKGTGTLGYRYASELAHAADVALEMVGDDDTGTVNLLVRKTRHAGTGAIPLRWVDGYSRFEVAP